MPTSERKPYRVYRQPRRVRGDGSIPWDTAPGGGRAPGDPSPPRRRVVRRSIRLLLLALLVAIIAAAVWGGIAYWSFRGAVQERNKAVPQKVLDALTPADGPMLTTPQTVLLLGSDDRGKDDAGRSDSMILMRVDIPRRRLAMLSIPRDLRVKIHGRDDHEKINAAYSLGGPVLTIKTIEDLTGVDINHLVVVDFSHFRELIDAVGGVDVNNPHRIISNSFDGRVWKFRRGKIHLNGKRALAYSRVRKNTLDPGESDFTRAQRQQAVLDALAHKVISPGSVLHPNKIPHAVVQPLTTELGANDFIALAIAKKWAKPENSLHCRLGGEIGMVDGQSVIVGDEQNRAVVNMWVGKQAPVKPDIHTNQFAPGCTRDSDPPVK